MRASLASRVDALEARAGLGGAEAAFGALDDDELGAFVGIMRTAVEGGQGSLVGEAGIVVGVVRDHERAVVAPPDVELDVVDAAGQGRLEGWQCVLARAVAARAHPVCADQHRVRADGPPHEDR